MLGQLRRDLSMLFARSRPPSLIRSRDLRKTRGREVEIVRVIQEATDIVTLLLRDPSGGVFRFLPGQFFSVLLEIDGRIVRRNYSASNIPGGSILRLTIKAKPDGLVSPRLARMAVGDRLAIEGPNGRFVVAPAPTKRRDLVLIAGGVGITPLHAILASVLPTEPASRIALVYGTRTADDIAFGESLRAFEQRHAPRFEVHHVVGLLERHTVLRILDRIAIAQSPETQFFICGPDAMRDEAIAALSERGVASERIAFERFSIPTRAELVDQPPVSSTRSQRGEPHRLTVFGGPRPIHTVVPDGSTLLEAGLAAGAPMSFSCAAGGCGACRVRLVEGHVEMDEPNCLLPSERAGGYVLACVGRPRGPCVIHTDEGALLETA